MTDFKAFPFFGKEAARILQEQFQRCCRSTDSHDGCCTGTRDNQFDLGREIVEPLRMPHQIDHQKPEAYAEDIKQAESPEIMKSRLKPVFSFSRKYPRCKAGCSQC